MLLSRTHRYQFLATVVANLAALAYGISRGWPSPILPLLQSTESPFQTSLSLEEISWIASLPLIGGMLGTPLFGWMAERFGRKNTLLVSVLPQICSWIIIEFSSSSLHLYVARFLVGFGGTGFYIAIPMYIAEISSNDIRGTLGSMMMLSKNLGIVVGYIINSYLDFYTVPFIVLSILITFLVLFPLAADSPKHLMTQNRVDEAVKALKYFRGYSKSDQHFIKEFSDEVQELKNCGKSADPLDSERLTIKDFCTKSAVLAIIIGMVIEYLEVATGFSAITNYSETIFTDAGSTLSPALSTVLLGVILIFGSCSSLLLVDRAGRKVLMIVSTIGCGLSLSIVATYAYCKDNGIDMTSYSWLPLVCLSSFMFLGSIGLFTLPLIIISEILAQKIRGTVISFLTFQSFTVSFANVKFFPILMEMIGMSGCMLIFASTCFAGALFLLWILPETKGRSIEDIVKELGGKKSK